MSSICMATVPGWPQHGHQAPLRLIVPCPIGLSCSRRCVALLPTTGTLVSMSKTTPVRPLFGSIVMRTRLLSFLHNHLVLRSGIVARQFLHVTVRAHRYATVGLSSIVG